MVTVNIACTITANIMVNVTLTNSRSKRIAILCQASSLRSLDASEWHGIG